MSFVGPTLRFLLALIAASSHHPFAAALSHGPLDGNNRQVSRRDALIGAASISTGGAVGAGLVLSSSPSDALAATSTGAETVDLAAFNAARVGGGGSPPTVVGIGKASDKVRRTIVPVADPSPLLPIRGGRGGASTLKIPRVGYSLYKTNPDQAARCVSLALRGGVRHLDVGALYGSNAEACKPLKKYLDGGFPALKGYYKDEKPELLDLLDATSEAAERHATQTLGVGSRSIAPPLDGSAGRRGRRDQLFVSHKVLNAEQSSDVVTVKRNVKNAISELGVGYLDLVSLHSPLMDRGRRLASYQALLELRDSGFVRSVGVCNFGLGPLKEIYDMVGGEAHPENLPAINQLELSPFNMHRDVVQYCDATGIAVGCSAWSKLSGVDGPSEGWAVLADLAKAKGVTKAQLLVRWSLQRGYVCVPRSGSASKVERMAIAENSYGGVNNPPFVLDEGDMKVLEGLDVGYRAGKLGRRDGWDDADVTGPEWDPTDIV